MLYYEEDNNTYEVEVDYNKLSKIAVLLDKDCFIIKHDIKSISAYSEDEAKNIIENQRNKAALKTNINYKILSIEEGLGWYHGNPYTVTYETIYRESIRLVSLIDSIFYSRNITPIYKEIKEYGNSIDFMPYSKRVELANKKLDNALTSHNKSLLKVTKEFKNILLESKLNSNYNFKKLYALYQEVLSCFKLTLKNEKTL